MDIFSVLTTMTIASIQGKHAKIGVVKTEYVLEVFVIVILAIQVKIVLKLFVQPVNIIIQRITHAVQHVLQKPIKINTQKHVCPALVSVQTVLTSPNYVLRASLLCKIHRSIITVYVIVSVQLEHIKLETLASIVTMLRLNARHVMGVLQIVLPV